MKILHINSYYSVSSFYKNLFDKQIGSGLDISVYVPVSKDADLSSIKLDNYTTVSRNHGKYDRIIFYIKHRKIFKDVMKKYDMNTFDLIHAHSLFSNGYIALELKKAYGIPYIVAVRNTDVNFFFKHMIHLRKTGIEILKEAERVIFLSPAYRDFVLSKYVPDNLKDKIRVKTQIIPNGIDDFWIKNKGNLKIYNYGENLKLLYVGVIDKNKNLTTTVKAIELLKEKGCNVCFTVVGRIIDDRVYKQLTEKPYIQYITPKTKEELIDIYRSSDIFVMPSITETFGIVYGEAMSQGLPIIYSRGQGFHGQFEEGQVGYGVDSFNKEEMADRILRICSSYEVISDNCIKLVDRFNWRDLTREYLKIYSNFSNKKSI